MSRWHSYLHSSKEILALYKGEEPFASFIKKYFAAQKKFGSADRKRITHLCYSYFRLGKALQDRPVDEKIIAGLFMCSAEPIELLEKLQPEWNEKTGLALPDKMEIMGTDLANETIFPWINELSPGIDKFGFVLSHLKQPDLFLRLRPGKETAVMQKLQAAGIEYRIISDSCLALPNSSKLDMVIELDSEAVVQDYSSQRVGEFLLLVRPGRSDNVWDCCAGSGGKSIMLYDLCRELELTISDIRKSMLVNLKKRFKKAGINRFNSFITDLTHSPLPISPSSFQLIIADVPCSGSGTWGRTPEQLTYFNTKWIDEYAVLQKKILSHVIPYLLPGGFLLYITCSVFQKENEEVVEFIKEKFHLKLGKMELFEGYNKRADTMFAALLSLPK